MGFGYLMRSADSLEKTLMLGKTEGKRRSGQQKMKWLDSIFNSTDTNEQLHFHFHALEEEMATHSNVLAWRIPGTGEPGGAAVSGVAQSQT